MKHIVFDVESIGIHGEGYAVGYVVCDSQMTPLSEGMFTYPPGRAHGSFDGHLWVRNLEYSLPVNCETPREVRTKFWEMWRYWVNLDKSESVYLWADCSWPVEGRFLIACIDDDRFVREWFGPYPLMDIAPLLLRAGKNPTAVYERLPEELPAHNPLHDARQSARILRVLFGGNP